jgi:hypothetical protein
MTAVNYPPRSSAPKPGDACDGCGALATRRVPFVRGSDCAAGYVLLCEGCLDLDTVHAITTHVAARGWCRG